jgi:hypothetical protein
VFWLTLPDGTAIKDTKSSYRRIEDRDGRKFFPSKISRPRFIEAIVMEEDRTTRRPRHTDSFGDFNKL